VKKLKNYSNSKTIPNPNIRFSTRWRVKTFQWYSSYQIKITNTKNVSFYCRIVANRLFSLCSIFSDDILFFLLNLRIKTWIKWSFEKKMKLKGPKQNKTKLKNNIFKFTPYVVERGCFWFHCQFRPLKF